MKVHGEVGPGALGREVAMTSREEAIPGAERGRAREGGRESEREREERVRKR